jgi:hypothetical protein
MSGQISLFLFHVGGFWESWDGVFQAKQARPFIQRFPSQSSHAHPHVQWCGVVDAALSHHSLSGFPVRTDDGLFSDHD